MEENNERADVNSEEYQEQEVSVEEMGQFGLFIPDIKLELDSEIKKGPIRRPKKLKSAVAGLMGEANIKYASGCTNEAIKMSMEVIRSAPDSPDPFQLLAIIYEESGQMEKSVQYSLVAAFLTKNSIDEWLGVANKALILENYKLACMCYEKVCKLEPLCEKHWETKCELMKKAGLESKKILESYCNILNIVKDQDGVRYILMARGIFMEYVSLKENEKAEEIMLKALEWHPGLVTNSDINLLIEVFFMDCKYQASLDIILKHCGVRIHDECIMDTQIQTISFENDLPVDLLAKLLISLIHLEMQPLVEVVLHKLLQEDCDVVGDLYMDVAEAFMKKTDNQRAEEILKLLVNSSKYNLPAVWLKYGEAVKSQQKLSEAVAIFSRVVEMVPDHVEARITLSGLYHNLGYIDQALLILNSSVNLENVTESDLKMLFGYCVFLEKQNKVKEYLKLANKVLKMCCNQALVEENKAEIIGNRQSRLRAFVFQHAKNEMFNKDDIPKKKIDLLPLANDIWELFVNLKIKLHSLRKYRQLDTLVLHMVVCPAFFSDQTRSHDLEFMCMVAGIWNKRATFAYYTVRLLILKGIDNHRVWNLLSRIVSVSQDCKHNRFLIRLAMKQPNHLALCQLNGNNALMAGSYKHALGEFFVCLKLEPLNALHHFLIGVCYTHLISQKFSSHRHLLTIQAVSFLNHYRLLRGNHQECCYNLGRAMHQLGLLTHAVSYYEKVLYSFPEDNDNPDFSLKREAAYNLCLIYSKTSPHLARTVMQQFLVV